MTNSGNYGKLYKIIKIIKIIRPSNAEGAEDMSTNCDGAVHRRVLANGAEGLCGDFVTKQPENSHRSKWIMSYRYR
jgi:hypothetical protein